MDEYTAILWSTCYASIRSFQFHPRVIPEYRLTPEQCAEEADEMIRLLVERGVLWLGSDQL